MAESAGYNLPDKLYFRIGEVSGIVDVKPYVLRYWETEFTDIKPTKSKSGQRLYKKRDVEMLLTIKELLYNERFTINGAKQRMREFARDGASVAHAAEPKGSGVRADAKARAKGEKQGPEPAQGAALNTDKKFLQKLKGDLEWCLSEIRS